jgi:DNA replication protein DnaC
MKPSRQVNMLLLKHHLKALRLPRVSAECEKTAKHCVADGTAHLGYLLRVRELELIERERKAAARRLKAAKFPALKTVTEFDFAASPTINRGLVLDVLKYKFISAT